MIGISLCKHQILTIAVTYVKAIIRKKILLIYGYRDMLEAVCHKILYFTI